MSSRRTRLGPEELDRYLTSSRLGLTLLATEACNFRCVYCYERFRTGRMEPWVVRALKRFLSRRAKGLEDLELSWFGGEPLLAADIIEEVMTHVSGIRRMAPDLHIASNVTTNAYLLTPSLASRLLELNVTGYHIAFDGPPRLHDRKRVLMRGGGSFDRIWSNLLGMRDLERSFQVTIRLHVDRENEPALPEFLDLLAADFGGDPRFQLFVRPLGRFGGARDETLPTHPTKNAGRAAVERVCALAAARGLPLQRLPSGPTVCYAAHGNWLVVRADGTLNKCALALEHPHNRVGSLRGDGTLSIDRARILPWLRGLFSGSEAELGCPMRGLADLGAGSRSGPPA